MGIFGHSTRSREADELVALVTQGGHEGFYTIERR